jgi:hypothetical protein
MLLPPWWPMMQQSKMDALGKLPNQRLFELPAHFPLHMARLILVQPDRS